MASRVISIEISQNLTRVCEIDYKVKNAKVYNCFTLPTPDGTIEDGFIMEPDDLGEMLRKELDARKIKTKQVVFSINSSRIANRETNLPFIKQNKIQSILDANASDYFPVDVTGYQLAYNILDTVENDSNKQYRLLVLAAPKPLLESYYALAEKAGLAITAIDYIGNSIIPVVNNLCKDEVTMVIKVDEMSTMLTIFREGNIVLQRTVPNGIDLVVRTAMDMEEFGKEKSYQETCRLLWEQPCIRNSFHPEKPDAADLNITDDPEFSESYQRAREELTDVLSTLVGSIIRVMDYYNSRNSAAQIQKIYLTGMGGELRGFEELLTSEMGIKVACIKNAEGLNLSQVEKNGETIPFGSYVTCFGAAISPIDFIPEEHKQKKGIDKLKDREKKQLGGNQVSILILAIGLLIAAVLVVVSVPPYIMQTTKNKSLKEKEEELAPAEIIYFDYMNTQTLYNNVQSMYNTTASNNEGLTELIQELEQKMPSHVNFTSFSADNNAITINMTVESKDAAGRAISMLRSFDSISDVATQQISEEIDEMGISKVTFTVVCTYRGAVPDEAALAEAQNAGSTETEVEEDVAAAAQ